jgi:N-acyl-phosphatidylethanolamine-hydrolysing phospholipase D
LGSYVVPLKKPLTSKKQKRWWLSFLCALTLFSLGAAGCLAPRPFDEKAWKAKVEAEHVSALYAAHRRPDGSFYNPWLPENRPWWSFWRWVLSENSLGPAAKQNPSTPIEQNNGAYLSDADAPDSLTWVGHATFVMQWSGQVVVIDPFFSEYAAVVKRNVPPAFGTEAIPDGAIVLISHNHYDHMDSGSLEALLPRAGLVLCPLGLGEFLHGVGATQVRELDWWQSVEINGSRFTCLPTQHWSRRFGQSYNQTLWCAWLMERDNKKIFYGADSGYFIGYREFGRKFPHIDIALLPLGAYYPRWFMHYAHMNLPEAMQAFSDLKARLMVPMQWGVLDLGDEPAALPRIELENYLAEHSKLKERVKLLPVGGRLLLDKKIRKMN